MQEYLFNKLTYPHLAVLTCISEAALTPQIGLQEFCLLHHQKGTEILYVHLAFLNLEYTKLSLEKLKSVNLGKDN